MFPPFSALYLTLRIYPAATLVPASLTDEQLKEMTSTFSSKRFPILVWAHPHSRATICRSGTIVVQEPPSPPSSPHLNSSPTHSNTVRTLSPSNNTKTDSSILEPFLATNPGSAIHIFDTGVATTFISVSGCRVHSLGLSDVWVFSSLSHFSIVTCV